MHEAAAPAANDTTGAPESDAFDTAAEGITEDLIAAIAADSARATVEENGDEPAPRDRAGKFTKKATEAADPAAAITADPAAVDGEELPEGEGLADADAIDLPEGMVAVPSIKAPMTAFKVFDADGELEAPAITIEFQANGKTRREPLDKLTKLAQWGVYNSEREQAVTASAQRVQEIESEHERIQGIMAAMEEKFRAVLMDDNVLLAEREAYAKDHTPEAQLERVKREQAEGETRRQMNELHQAGSTFFSAEVLPSLEVIKSKLSNVSPQEIDAKAVLDSERFKTIRLPNGDRAIHPKHYDAYRRYIVNELIPWAQHINDARASERGTVVKSITDKANAKVEDAQIRAQKGKSAISKTLRPHRRGAPVSAPPKPKVNAGIDDAMDDALSATLAAVGVHRGT